MKFYVYEHWRPDTGTCFYVGKGKGRRAYHFKRNGHYNNIIAKLSRLGMCVDVRIVGHGLTEQEAHRLEIERIAYWKASSVKLVNMTNGGEGTSGLLHTNEWRANMSAVHLGKKETDETREKKRLAALARPPLDETITTKISASVEALWRDGEYRKRLSEAHKGKAASAATKAAIGAFGKLPKSPEHKARIAAGLKAAHERKRLAGTNKMPADFGAKITAANTGKKRSAETRARLSAGIKAWHASKKLSTG